MKFRKLTGEDINLIKNLCENRKEYNFFILINLEALKNNQDLIQYYGMFDDNEMLIAVGMFYHRLLYIEISNTGFINVFINYLKSLGKESIILNNTLDLSVEEYFNNYQIEYHKKGYLFMYQGSKENIDYNNVKQATLDDVDALIEFYESAPLDVKRGKDSIARSLSNNRRTFIYKENGDIFASILTTGETLDTAMIGGVHYLNDEVLNCVLRVIVNELQMLGKKVYVVLRDSTMIRVFKETGFTKLKPWSMVGLRRS